jgi:hypothetical protein
MDATGIDRATAIAYDGLLEHLLVTERLPACSVDRLNRLVRRPTVTSWTWPLAQTAAGRR